MTPMNEQFANVLRNMFPMTGDTAGMGQGMFPFNEQLTSVARASLETQIAVATTVSTAALDSARKVMDLNLNAARASLEDCAEVTRQFLGARDPQEFASIATSQAQPAVAKAIAYSRHLAGIATDTQVELTQASEQRIADIGRRMLSVMDDAMKNAPAGSENLMAMMRSAMGNANASYTQFSKTTRQAAQAVDANLTNATNQFMQAAEQGSGGNGRAKK
jgi:phasin family protein